MKRLIIPAAVLTAAVFAAPPARAQVKVKVATQAPKGTLWMEAMDDIAKAVKKKTKKRVVFKFYPNGTLGDEKVVINRMKTNEIDGGLFTGIGLGQVLPKIRVLELPFIYRNGTDEHDRVRDLIEAEIIKDFDRQGYIFLGWSEVGWAYMFSKVESPDLEALQSRKCWFWQDDPLAEAAFKAYGLKGVPLALTDVLPSLNSNMIDTVYNSPYGLIGLQWHTKVKFMSRMTVGHGTGALLISKRIFKKIPKKYRDEVTKICRKRLRKLIKEIKDANLEAEKDLQSQGIKILPLPKDEVADYEARGLKVAKEMVGKLYSEEFLNKVLKAVEESRKKP